MQKNTYYEDQPVYEEIELQNKAKPTDVSLKPSKRISSGNIDKINGSTSTNRTNLRGKCCLVVVLFPLAIAMVAALALSVYALMDSNQGMDSLMTDIQKLKMQLNETKEASETEIAKLKRDLTRIETDGLTLQNSVDTVNTTTMAKLGNLLSSVKTLNITDNNFMIEFNNIQSLVSSLNTANGATTTQLNSLQSSVSSLNTANGATTTQLNSLQSSVSSLNTANGATTTQLNSLQSSVTSLNTANGATTTQLNSLQSSVSSLNTANGATTTQLNSLQSSVNSLTTQVNSPVNLYQNCIQETESCTIGPRTTDTYWAQCYTDYAPISKAVSLVWALSTQII